MSKMELKPLEVTDFSGGITDFFFQGVPRRYQYADNLLIDVDKSLFVRPGSQGYDSTNYKLSSLRRIDSLFSFRDQGTLFANQAEDLYYLNATPVWTNLEGPSNPGVPYGLEKHSLSVTEWNSHLLLTTDNGGIPSKIYVDDNGAFQLRTLGLPIPESTPRYTTSSLLSACIQRANDLRLIFLAHIQDAVVHISVDATSLALIDAACTTEATLYTLIESLFETLESHRNAGYSGTIHREVFGPSFTDTTINTDTPTTLAEAATRLDLIKREYNRHRREPYSHSAVNHNAEVEANPFTGADLLPADVTGIPQFTANFSRLVDFSNSLVDTYNTHVQSYGLSGAHTMSLADLEAVGFYTITDVNPGGLNSTNPYPLIGLSTATDLEGAIANIYWAYLLYNHIHLPDSRLVTSYAQVTYDASNGSASLTDIKDSAAAAFTPTTGRFLTNKDDAVAVWNNTNGITVRLTSPGSGTATASSTASGAQADTRGQISAAKFHVYKDGDGVLIDSILSPSGDSEYVSVDAPTDSALGIDTGALLPTTVEGWYALGLAVESAMYDHIANAQSHINAVTTHTVTDDDGVASYSYAFVWKSTYTNSNGVEFVVRSEPLIFGPVETGPIIAPTSTDDYSLALSNLPVLSNDSFTNYSTSDLELEIYRTQDGGTNYYLVTTVDNGTLTFTDGIIDNEDSPSGDRLTSGESLYTTGGFSANSLPPRSKFIHTIGNLTYFGGVYDGDSFFNNRVLQSIPNSPDGAPATYSDDIEDEISGLSSVRNKLIVLGKHSLYRVEGQFDNRGQGTMIHERISDTLGCVSSKSIIQTEIGVFFAGNDGFYYTDGYQIIKVSIDLDETYKKLVETEDQANLIYGTFDRLNRRIWWAVCSQSSSEECDKGFIFHVNYGVKPSGAFTTVSNSTHFQPSAWYFFQNELIRGDSRGLIFRHNEEYKSDPKVPADPSAALSTWGTVHIPYQFSSSALDFGSTYKGQYVTKIHVLGENRGNAYVQMYGVADNNNFSPSKGALAPIRYSDNPIWDDPSINWGDSTYNWKYDGKLDYKRRFPKGSIRSQLKQVLIEPARIGVYNYDEYPEFSFCTVNDVGNTATLLTPTGYSDVIWPLDVVGMYIAFSSDNYVNELLITAVADEVITFTDPDALITGNLSNQKWVIRGYLKEGGFSLTSYAIEFSQFGERGRAYRNGADRGENV